MQIKNLSQEETDKLLDLAECLAMGNTEYDNLTEIAKTFIDVATARRTRLANALRALSAAAQELNDAWDDAPQFYLRVGQPKWFPSYDEMAQDIHHWVTSSLPEVDPNHVEPE